MRIHELGDGTPEVAVVGAIHGDEPCGARAIERFVADEPDVDRPVKLIIANEEALAAETRYLDVDLNRVFPGDADADTHEERLAHALAREVRGCTTLSLHSTQSYAEAFALVSKLDAASREVCRNLPIDIVVEAEGFTNGRLIEHPHTVECECGLQGTEQAAENAYDLVRAFLNATDVYPSESTYEESREVSAFSLSEVIPKERGVRYEVFVNNFERVEAGETFAAIDGEAIVAKRTFFPILLSAYGYRDIFGYVGEREGLV